MTDDFEYTPDQEPQFDEAKLIARDNDAFRKMPNPEHGDVVITHTVNDLHDMTKRQLVTLVQTFENFTEENDPWGHHDFGSITLGGETYFWKLDLYDRATKTMYTPDPTSSDATWRVLTIMHASDW